jgi:Mg2+/Co2+ transporter CorB
MTLTYAILFGLVIALLILSAFFSGSETALTATSRARIHQLERRGNKRAHIVQRLIEARETLIGAILLGNNLVNILASALATSVFVQLFGNAGVAYATLIMTALVLIFSEVMPKTYAIANAERMALAVAVPIRTIVAIFGPITATIQFIVRRTLRLFGADIDDTAMVLSAHDELRGAIAFHHHEGAVVKYDKDMLGGILDLRDLEVFDVMLHRTKMETVDADAKPADIVDQVLKSGFTRLPVWKDDQDNIIGILHAKELLKALAKGDADKLNIEALCAPPWFVPESTNLQAQLNAFLRKKTHFALVVDEYGEVMGLVTLEDILEEIVGEIADEHDAPATGVRQQPDGSVTVDGTVAIRDLNRSMDWELPDDEATTIAGLVIHEAQMIPDIGQAFTFYSFKFEVLRKRRNQLTVLRITPARKLVV